MASRPVDLTTNLAVFTNHCINAFEDHLQMDTTYTNFAKAFDKVCHSALKAKLSKPGFHSSFLNWIASYLDNQRYHVEVGGALSHPYKATSGLPQSSSRGPLLFIIFINDICACTHFSSFLHYAIDLKIYWTVSNVNDSILLQSDLDSIGSWCTKNSLPLNLNKCHIVRYAKRSVTIPSTYHSNNHPLPVLNEIVDLGVLFDDKFLFNEHLNFILPKAYAIIGFVKRNTILFQDPYSRLSVYFASVRSRVKYASFIWNTSGSVHINRIERLQKKFLKFVLQSLHFTEPAPPYDSNGTLLHTCSLMDRRATAGLLFPNDLLVGNIDCPSLLGCISFNVPARTVDSFLDRAVRTNYARNEPLLRALRLFTSLPSSIRFSWGPRKIC